MCRASGKASSARRPTKSPSRRFTSSVGVRVPGVPTRDPTHLTNAITERGGNEAYVPIVSRNGTIIAHGVGTTRPHATVWKTVARLPRRLPAAGGLLALFRSSACAAVVLRLADVRPIRLGLLDGVSRFIPRGAVSAGSFVTAGGSVFLVPSSIALASPIVGAVVPPRADIASRSIDVIALWDSTLPSHRSPCSARRTHSVGLGGSIVLGGANGSLRAAAGDPQTQVTDPLRSVRAGRFAPEHEALNGGLCGP